MKCAGSGWGTWTAPQGRAWTRCSRRTTSGALCPPWPGTAHFQLRDRIPGETPTYGALLPSQPLEALDADTATRYTSAVTAGHRPAALALAWVEDIYVRAEHPERFLVAAVLDGHHKLAAYAAAGVPARGLLLSRAEDNRGPEAGWSKAFDEALGQLQDGRRRAARPGTDAGRYCVRLRCGPGTRKACRRRSGAPPCRSPDRPTSASPARPGTWPQPNASGRTASG
ncbi:MULTISPECIES: hypothetical protein [unclassified Streptomyces]|uniref:hypothetical protein n=1 Tax=unclassified Streptomyces TaxID=2593676 RepID=UPI0032542B0E